jgi:hypothetical protein
MEPVREHWDEVPKHVRGSWEAVQKKNRRRILWARLAVKDIQPVYLLAPVKSLKSVVFSCKVTIFGLLSFEIEFIFN